MPDGPRRNNIFGVNYGLRSLRDFQLIAFTTFCHHVALMSQLEYVRARSFLFVCKIVLLVFSFHETMSLLLILKNFHIRILTLSSQVCTSSSFSSGMCSN